MAEAELLDQPRRLGPGRRPAKGGGTELVVVVKGGEEAGEAQAARHDAQEVLEHLATAKINLKRRVLPRERASAGGERP